MAWCNVPSTRKIKTAGISRHECAQAMYEWKAVRKRFTSLSAQNNVFHFKQNRDQQCADQANGSDFIFVFACVMDGLLLFFCFTVQLEHLTDFTVRYTLWLVCRAARWF